MSRNNPTVADLFSTKQASDVLHRTAFCIWYHATRNLDPVWVGGRVFLTKAMMKTLAENHLRMKPGEDLAEMVARIDQAKTKVSS